VIDMDDMEFWLRDPESGDRIDFPEDTIIGSHHLKQRHAEKIVEFAVRHEIDPEIFRYVTGVYGESRDDLTEEEAGNAAWPAKTLGVAEVRELHQFITDVFGELERIDEIDKILARVSNAPTDQSIEELFDPEEYRRYITQSRLEGLKKRTEAAVQHDLAMSVDES